jgi:hypothetical protein
MMFAGRAAATKSNILFDTGASCNFVSKKFAKQTGITVRPVEYSVRLADDKATEVAGGAVGSERRASVPRIGSPCGVRPCSTRGGLCRGSVSGCANLFCPT